MADETIQFDEKEKVDLRGLAGKAGKELGKAKAKLDEKIDAEENKGAGRKSQEYHDAVAQKKLLDFGEKAAKPVLSLVDNTVVVILGEKYQVTPEELDQWAEYAALAAPELLPEELTRKEGTSVFLIYTASMYANKAINATDVKKKEPLAVKIRDWIKGLKGETGEKVYTRNHGKDRPGENDIPDRENHPGG